MDPLEAIEIVARRVLSDVVYEVPFLWGDYPDIGEDDWLAICKRVTQLSLPPSVEKYATAYECLAKRADPND